MKKQALEFTDRDRRIIKKFLIGGAAAGGSYGLGMSLANYLKSLHSEVEDEDDTSKDDNTLYLDLPGKQASLSGSLGITGGTLAAMGTYGLVTKLFNEIKRRRIQEQLDSAQSVYLADLVGAPEGDIELGKQAGANPPAAPATPAPSEGGKSMGGVELLLSSPLALTLLLGLGSGAVTHHVLNKSFPRVKQPKVQGPKRVVVRRGGGKGKTKDDKTKNDKTKDEPAIDAEKIASYDDLPESWIHADGVEQVARLLMSHQKTASADLLDFVGAMASGQHDTLVAGIEGGIDQCLDMVKGASENLGNGERDTLGLGLAVRSNLMGPVFSVLVASEFNDRFPHYVKAAASLPEGTRETLRRISGVVGAMSRRDSVDRSWDDSELEKSASGLAGALLAAIGEGAGDGEEDILESAKDLDVREGDRSDGDIDQDAGGDDAIDAMLAPDLLSENTAPHEEEETG